MVRREGGCALRARVAGPRSTTFADFSVQHYFCMIFRFPVMQPPVLILAGRWPCMLWFSHSGEKSDLLL